MKNNGAVRNVYSFNSFGSRPLFRYLLIQHREDFLNVLSKLNLTPEEIIQGFRILNAQEQAALFGLACQLRASDRFIGLNSAKLHDIHDSGLPGILARSCGTIREMAEIHEKYYSKLDSEGVLSRLEFADSSMTYVFENLMHAPAAIQEYALATTFIALTSLSSEVKNFGMCFEFPSPPDSYGFSEQDRQKICEDFSIQLKYSTGRLALRLGMGVLDVTIPTVDPSLKTLLERKLRVLTGQTLAEDTDELRGQVFTAILELSSASEVITLDSVAHYMGVKSEALSYALRSHGIQFQKLKESLGYAD
jgi:hypothetical protein